MDNDRDTFFEEYSKSNTPENEQPLTCGSPTSNCLNDQIGYTSSSPLLHDSRNEALMPPSLMEAENIDSSTDIKNMQLLTGKRGQSANVVSEEFGFPEFETSDNISKLKQSPTAAGNDDLANFQKPIYEETQESSVARREHCMTVHDSTINDCESTANGKIEDGCNKEYHNEGNPLVDETKAINTRDVTVEGYSNLPEERVTMERGDNDRVSRERGDINNSVSVSMERGNETESNDIYTERQEETNKIDSVETGKDIEISDGVSVDRKESETGEELEEGELQDDDENVTTLSSEKCQPTTDSPQIEVRAASDAEVNRLCEGDEAPNMEVDGEVSSSKEWSSGGRKRKHRSGEEHRKRKKKRHHRNSPDPETESEPSHRDAPHCQQGQTPKSSTSSSSMPASSHRKSKKILPLLGSNSDDFDTLLQREICNIVGSKLAQSGEAVSEDDQQKIIGLLKQLKERGGQRNEDSMESGSEGEWDDGRRRKSRPLKNRTSPLKKDTPCIYYVQGRCRQGSMCPYLHDGPPKRKMELCKFYMMDCCAKKSKCLYMHNDFPCKFFHFGMKCVAGDRCKFSHSALQEAAKGILLKHIEMAPKDILGEFPRVSKEDGLRILSLTEDRKTGRPIDPQDLISVVAFEGRGFKYLDQAFKSARKKLGDESDAIFGPKRRDKPRQDDDGETSPKKMRTNRERNREPSGGVRAPRDRRERGPRDPTGARDSPSRRDYTGGGRHHRERVGAMGDSAFSRRERGATFDDSAYPHRESGGDFDDPAFSHRERGGAMGDDDLFNREMEGDPDDPAFSRRERGGGAPHDPTYSHRDRIRSPFRNAHGSTTPPYPRADPTDDGENYDEYTSANFDGPERLDPRDHAPARRRPRRDRERYGEHDNALDPRSRHPGGVEDRDAFFESCRNGDPGFEDRENQPRREGDGVGQQRPLRQFSQSSLPDIDVMYLKNVLSAVQNQQVQKNFSSQDEKLAAASPNDPAETSTTPPNEQENCFAAMANDIKSVFEDSFNTGDESDTPPRENLQPRIPLLPLPTTTTASRLSSECRDTGPPFESQMSSQEVPRNSQRMSDPRIRDRYQNHPTFDSSSLPNDYSSPADCDSNVLNSHGVKSTPNIQEEMYQYSPRSDSGRIKGRQDLSIRRQSIDEKYSIYTMGDAEDLQISDSLDENLMSLPFKVPVHSSAKEIDGSYNAQFSLSYQLIPVTVQKPDFSRFRVTPDSKLSEDPRVQKMLRRNSSENSLRSRSDSDGSVGHPDGASPRDRESRDPRKRSTRDPRMVGNPTAFEFNPADIRRSPNANFDKRAFDNRLGQPESMIDHARLDPTRDRRLDSRDPRMESRDPRMDSSRDPRIESSRDPRMDARTTAQIQNRDPRFDDRELDMMEMRVPRHLDSLSDARLRRGSRDDISLMEMRSPPQKEFMDAQTLPMYCDIPNASMNNMPQSLDPRGKPGLLGPRPVFRPLGLPLPIGQPIFGAPFLIPNNIGGQLQPGLPLMPSEGNIVGDLSLRAPISEPSGVLGRKPVSRDPRSRRD